MTDDPFHELRFRHDAALHPVSQEHVETFFALVEANRAGGRYLDCVVYGLLQEEWLAGQRDRERPGASFRA